MNRRAGFLIAGLLIAVLVVLAAALAIVVVLRTDRTGKKGSGLPEEYTYDLSRFRQVDPKLIQFKEAEPIRTGLQEVRGLAVGKDGRVYVAGDKAVRVFGKDGKLASETKLADSPRCLAVAEDGTVYVGLLDHVEVYDASGARTASWQGLGRDAVLTCIALSPSDVFVADAGNRIVLRYEPSGKLVRRIGEKDENKDVPGFIIPSPHFDLAVGAEGLLWVVNPGHHRIEAYTFDGDREAWWGKAAAGIEGFCGCCNPADFALLPDGRFVTSEKGLPRVKLYSPEGEFECVVAAPDLFGESTAAMDVAADGQGRILVLDPGAKSVRIFVRK